MGISLVGELIIVVVYEWAALADWLKNMTINIYKGKGDSLDRRNSRCWIRESEYYWVPATVP